MVPPGDGLTFFETPEFLARVAGLPAVYDGVMEFLANRPNVGIPICGVLKSVEVPIGGVVYTVIVGRMKQTVAVLGIFQIPPDGPKFDDRLEKLRSKFCPGRK